MVSNTYSAVATTYNDESVIIEYLQEMCSQTLPPNEIVVADGGSKDLTVSLIEHFAKESSIPIVVVQKGRLNISQGYNEAIKAAKSELIGITGVGNRYSEDYFDKLSKPFADTELDLSYSPIRGFDTTEFSKRYNRFFLHGDQGQRLKIASNHGAMVKKAVFEELGYFYEHFIYAGEDGEFYTLVKDKGYKTIMVEDANVYWDTPHNWKEFLKQIRVYTIGDLQIRGKKQWETLKGRITKVILALVFLICFSCALIIVHNHYFRAALLGCVALGIIVERKRMNPIRLARQYLPIWYTIKFRKYMGKEYTVKR